MRSPSARVLRNRVDHYAASEGQDSSAGVVYSYPTAPTASGLACSVQYRRAELDETTFDRPTVVNVYHVLFGADPGASPRDILAWSEGGIARTLYVQVNPPSEAGRGAASVIRCVEKT